MSRPGLFWGGNEQAMPSQENEVAWEEESLLPSLEIRRDASTGLIVYVDGRHVVRDERGLIIGLE
jgi:hypothetical protein